MKDEIIISTDLPVKTAVYNKGKKVVDAQATVRTVIGKISSFKVMKEKEKKKLSEK